MSREDFRALVRALRYEEAFEEGERLIARGLDAPALGALRHPWQEERLDRVPAAHRRELERLAGSGRRSPWPHFYLGLLGNDLPSLGRVLASPAARYGWMHAGAAEVFLCEGRVGLAHRLFRKSLAQEPVDWKTHCYLAETLLCLGREEAAYGEMSRAMGRAPADLLPQALAWRGELKLWMGRYGPALEDLEAACRFDERGARFGLAWRGAAKLKLGRAREALEDIDRGLAVHPTDREARVWRGEALRELGRPEEALRELSREPVGAWARMNAGLCRSALGDAEGPARELGLLPPRAASYLRRRLGLPARGTVSRGQAEAALAAGLALGKGLRRDEPYAERIWMR